MRHVSWNEASGLSGAVYSLAQTTDGFLWIGTSTGLYRFDGIRFEPYLELSGNHPISEIRALLPTRDGGLWIGYRGGVAFLKQDNAAFYTEQQGLPYGRVSSLAQTQDGAIWAAVTLSGGGKSDGGRSPLAGLARLSNGRWEQIRFDWNYPATSTERVFVDSAGTLWVTGGEAVYFLLRGSRKFQHTAVKVSTWTQLCAGPDGSVWIVDSLAHMLFNFRKSPEKGYVAIAGRPFQGIYGIHFDPAGSFWLATDRGLYRVPRGLIGPRPSVSSAEIEKDWFRVIDGLSSTETNVVLPDQEGNIWVGTTSGLDRFSDRSVTQIDMDHTPSDLIAGPHSEVWASPFHAPFLIPLHNSAAYPVPDWYTLTFHMDRSDTLWVGTQPGPTWESRALWKDRNGRLTMVPSPPDVKGPSIEGIVSDAIGRIWMTVKGYGEYILKDNKWEQVSVFSGEDSNISPDAEFVDAMGRGWLVYYARDTVVMVDGERHTFFTPANGLDLGNPIAGWACSTQVWVSGTNGLGFFDGRRFQNIRAFDGSLFKNVTAVIPTDHDGLWLKAPNGVVQVPQDELETFFRDHTHPVRYRSFDGTTDFVTQLTRSKPSPIRSDVVRSSDGKLWFSVFDGVAMIDPAHLAKNDAPPPVFIRGLIANGRTYSTYHNLTLPKSTTEVSLDYTALSLTLSERNRFRYQLVGVDKEWRDVGTRRQAFYTNLAPGTYTFKVIGANNDGVWNETGASVTFNIPPMFVQTIWFRTLVVFIIAILLWTFFLIRLRQMNKQTEARLHERLVERERIARELHDTLLQGFQMLVLRFQVIIDTLSPDNPATELLQESLVRSERALQEGRDRVSALRSETESGDDFAADIRRFGDDLSSASTTAFDFSIEGTPTPLQTVVHEEVRMIAREAIANAFRHAGAAAIKCQLKFARRHFVFICSDDGCGIPEGMFGTKKLRNHWGIAGMQERTRKIGAALHIQPGDPCGTRIELKLRAAIAYAAKTQSRVARFLKRVYP
jgi:signal transduction histidine kinase/ligand-binding sensor domain-containing protein